MNILGPNPERASGTADRSRLDLSWAEASKRLTPLNLLTSRPEGDAEGGVEAGEEGGTIDLLLLGLVERLPRPDQYWSLDDRAKWLRTAATIFALVYKTGPGDEGDIGVMLTKRGRPQETGAEASAPSAPRSDTATQSDFPM
jgi:hypothetical protein